MKLYNSYKGLLLFTILFLLWAYTLGKSCPHDKDTKCTRYEFYGVQLNHFFLFLFLGYFFPSFFFTIQTMGILWELFEYYLDKNPYDGNKPYWWMFNVPTKRLQTIKTIQF